MRVIIALLCMTVSAWALPPTAFDAAWDVSEYETVTPIEYETNLVWCYNFSDETACGNGIYSNEPPSGWIVNATQATASTRPTWLTNGGGCVDFDGTNDFIQVADGNVDPLDTVTDSDVITFALWINPDVISASASDEDTVVWSPSVIHRLQTGDDLEAYFYGADNALNAFAFVQDAWTTNEWQHMVMTFDASTYFIYRNGVLMGSNTSFAAEGVGAAQATAVLGAHINTSDDVYDGKIDAVRCYNSALSSSEVYNVYNDSKSDYGL